MKIYSTVLRALLVPIAATMVGVGSAHEVTNSVATPIAQNPSGVFPPNGNMVGNLAPAGGMVPGLPFGASEVVKMYQGGIGKDIIVNYVESAVLPFHLSADNIIALQNLGVPQEITKAIIVRDGQLQQQAALYAQQMAANPANQMAMPPQQGQQEPVAMPSTPPPVVNYSGDYYDSGYPNYYVVGGYPYYGYGWGWPYYYGGFRGFGFRGGFPGGFHNGFHGGFGGGFHGGVGGGFHGGGGGFHGGGGGHAGGGGGHGGGGHR